MQEPAFKGILMAHWAQKLKELADAPSSGLVITYANAERFPEADRYAAEGMIEMISQTSDPQAYCRSERVSPDRIPNCS